MDSKKIADPEKNAQETESETKSTHVVEALNEFASTTLEQSGQPRAISPAMKSAARWQMFAVCFSLFLAGWDGGTMGPLLPKIQSFYHVFYPSFSVSLNV